LASDGALTGGALVPRTAGGSTSAEDQPPPQHLLNFLPLPHGHGSFRPTFGAVAGPGCCAGRDLTGFTWFQIDLFGSLLKQAHGDNSATVSVIRW